MFDGLNSVAGKQSMRSSRIHFSSAILHKNIHSAHKRPARIGNIIDDQSNLVFEISHKFHTRDLIGDIAFLVDDRELPIPHETLAVALRTHHSTRIRRHDYET